MIFPQTLKMGEGSKQNDIMELERFSFKIEVGY